MSKNKCQFSTTSLTVIYTLTCLLFIAAAFSIAPSPVPVLENELKVSGTVVEVCVVSATDLHIQPEQPIFQVRILVERIEVIQPPNFLQGKLGETVTLLSKEKIAQDFLRKDLTF